MGLSAFVGLSGGWLSRRAGFVFGLRQIRKHPRGRYYFDNFYEHAVVGTLCARSPWSLYAHVGNLDHFGRAIWKD